MKLSRGTSLSVVVGVCIAFGPLSWPGNVHWQQGSSEQPPTIDEYNPKSPLIVPEHNIERAKFPFIDIHRHHWKPPPAHIDQLVKEMDTINLRVLVNLSGGTGDQLRNTVL